MTHQPAPSMPAAPSPQAIPFLERPLLTYTILTILIGALLVEGVYQQVSDTATLSYPLLTWGALDFQRVVRYGEHYRLFTAMFLHAGQIHLLFNAFALFFYGRSLEHMWGRGRFAAIYLLGGLSGSLASLIFNRGTSIGASGAIFAIFGSYIVFIYQNRILFGELGKRELRNLAGFAALNFGLGLLTQVIPGTRGIDNWGHIGGFVGGIILGSLITPLYLPSGEFFTPSEGGAPRQRIVRGRPFRQTWYIPLIYAAALLVIYIFALGSLR
ncbi:MAG TPA: rhomboid family intramembrane serine protease [Aggregatilineales bacterium]|nr:rhomboid family intramembrane serine protease [Anaerolineales bacterium]HRE47581.1 rhomboid family intramembrane serine protease [Aggregatilineales bacterium]